MVALSFIVNLLLFEFLQLFHIALLEHLVMLANAEDLLPPLVEFLFFLLQVCFVLACVGELFLEFKLEGFDFLLLLLELFLVGVVFVNMG